MMLVDDASCDCKFQKKIGVASVPLGSPAFFLRARTARPVGKAESEDSSRATSAMRKSNQNATRRNSRSKFVGSDA